LFRDEVLCLFKGLERETVKGFGNMKVVCIKDTVTKYNSKCNTYESSDPFLVIGKVYNGIADGVGVIIFENEKCDTWLSYERGIFVTQDEWRDRQLNGLGL
jgi:hypothetical protein